MQRRDYRAIAAGVLQRVSSGSDLELRLRAVVEELWAGLSTGGVSWCGFYLPSADGERLTLGPCRNKPACSPLELHGVCGRVLREKRPLIVPDVSVLGGAYIACDPLDRAELALPVLDRDGKCCAVLDLDSHQPDAFGQDDLEGLRVVLEAAGLSYPDATAEGREPER